MGVHVHQQPLKVEQVALPDAVSAWFGRARPLEAGERLCEPLARDGRMHFVRRGWLAQGRLLRDGRRQITALYLPGEPVQPNEATYSSADVITTALNPSLVASVPLEEVEDAASRDPALRDWLTRAVHRRCATLEERVVSLGQRSALERTAHFLCEVLVRCGGDEPPGECALPLTQADLADAMGLSVVHMNRMLQLLRRMSLADVRRGRLAVADFAALVQLAGFDGDYLR